MNKFISIFLVLIAVAFISCDDDDSAQPITEDTIIAGVGLGNLKVGRSSAEQVIDIFGPGISDTTVVGIYRLLSIEYPDLGMKFNCGALFDPNQYLITSIEFVSDFEGSTEEGIRIGSDREAVIEAYGEPDEVYSPTFVWYDIGISGAGFNVYYDRTFEDGVEKFIVDRMMI